MTPTIETMSIVVAAMEIAIARGVEAMHEAVGNYSLKGYATHVPRCRNFPMSVKQTGKR